MNFPVLFVFGALVFVFGVRVIVREVDARVFADMVVERRSFIGDVFDAGHVIEPVTVGIITEEPLGQICDGKARLPSRFPMAEIGGFRVVFQGQ